MNLGMGLDVHQRWQNLTEHSCSAQLLREELLSQILKCPFSGSTDPYRRSARYLYTFVPGRWPRMAVRGNAILRIASAIEAPMAMARPMSTPANMTPKRAALNTIQSNLFTCQQDIHMSEMSTHSTAVLVLCRSPNATSMAYSRLHAACVSTCQSKFEHNGKRQVKSH